MALYFLPQRVARRAGSAPGGVGAGGQERVDGGEAEALGGGVQGRAPVLIGRVDLGPQLQQQADLVLAGPAGALVKGAPAVVVGGVDVLAALHEPADELVGAGRDVQGRGPAARFAGADLAVGQLGEGLLDPALLHERAQVLGQGRAQTGHGRLPPVRVRVRTAGRPRRNGTRVEPVSARPRCPADPVRSSGWPPWSPPNRRPSFRGLAAAPFVQIRHKGPDRTGAPEENRGYSALSFAADPVADRLCGRFGHAPAPDRPRSPTRTIPRPPIPVTAPIRAREPSLPARKAQ